MALVSESPEEQTNKRYMPDTQSWRCSAGLGLTEGSWEKGNVGWMEVSATQAQNQFTEKLS